MKKLKYVALMVIMMMVTVLAVNNVYADGYSQNGLYAETNINNYWDADEEEMQAFYYPGDTIEIDIAFEEEYYTSFENNKKITDFDISLAGGTGGLGGRGLLLTPVLNGANWSDKSGSIYYIQQLPVAQKLTFVGGEKLAKYVEKINDDYFDSLPDESDDAYNAQLKLATTKYVKLFAKYYFNDGTMQEFENGEISLPIIPYVSGDFNLDKDVDFFDITSLITAVYETETETLGWRNREAVTTNTKGYTTDENYNHRTAELGFTDIIYLIKEIYG